MKARDPVDLFEGASARCSSVYLISHEEELGGKQLHGLRRYVPIKVLLEQLWPSFCVVFKRRAVSSNCGLTLVICDDHVEACLHFVFYFQ